ncbi:hypothetical protein KIN20_023505 [Parelaphostrongylus tenuis]|uniref:Uncharacterized protein n=1 Tax=Parelaphostrongylus tenuis TaxID=148309 RepID=A0AAD5MVR2_PARTN|nr:hypothetical protein KIN20_023505 [Parelaphostrongylus tenuis]
MVDPVEHLQCSTNRISGQCDRCVRAPSLSVRLFSRQSTYDEPGGSGYSSTKSVNYPLESGAFGLFTVLYYRKISSVVLA